MALNTTVAQMDEVNPIEPPQAVSIQPNAEKQSAKERPPGWACALLPWSAFCGCVIAGAIMDSAGPRSQTAWFLAQLLICVAAGLLLGGFAKCFVEFFAKPRRRTSPTLVMGILGLTLATWTAIWVERYLLETNPWSEYGFRRGPVRDFEIFEIP